MFGGADDELAMSIRGKQRQCTAQMMDNGRIESKMNKNKCRPMLSYTGRKQPVVGCVGSTRERGMLQVSCCCAISNESRCRQRAARKTRKTWNSQTLLGSNGPDHI